MLDFPSNPQIGDKLELSGITWMWDGTKWVQGPATPPPSPAQGDVRFDSGMLQQFDGTAWQEIETGGGGGGGWPAMGVTDNSNAAPGEVGEVINSIPSPATFPASATWVTASTLNVTAGDWDVTGQFGVSNSSGSFSAVGGQITLPAETPYITGSMDVTGSGVYLAAANLSVSISLPYGTRRISTNAATEVRASVLCSFTGAVYGNPTAQARLYARRMR